MLKISSIDPVRGLGLAHVPALGRRGYENDGTGDTPLFQVGMRGGGV
jgi:hypothetical protein